MNDPDEDPDYWQCYGVIIGDSTLYNLRVKMWPHLVDLHGEIYLVKRRIQ